MILGQPCTTLPCSSQQRIAVYSCSHSSRRSARVQPRAQWGQGTQTADSENAIAAARTVLDAVAFVPRVVAGAVLSSQETDSTVRRLPSDIQELSEAAVVLAERGQQAEYEIFEAVSAVIPADVRSSIEVALPWQLRQLAPRPSAQPTVIDVESVAAVQTPSVILQAANSPETLLANQLAAELTTLKEAVNVVHEALQALLASQDPAQEAMLQLNLKEARSTLARRLEQLSPQCSQGVGAEAASEATMLLVSLDDLL